MYARAIFGVGFEMARCRFYDASDLKCGLAGDSCEGNPNMPEQCHKYVYFFTPEKRFRHWYAYR